MFIGLTPGHQESGAPTSPDTWITATNLLLLVNVASLFIKRLLQGGGAVAVHAREGVLCIAIGRSHVQGSAD